MKTYHGSQRCNIHDDAKHNTQNPHNRGPSVLIVNEANNERANGHDDDDLSDDGQDDVELLLGGRVADVDDEVAELDDDAGAVDGEDEGAVGVDDGEAVEAPEEAVQEGGEVGEGGELLHVLLFAYGHKCWPRERKYLHVL